MTEKRSLHIGVDRTDRALYPEPFEELSACVRDALAMEKVAAAAGFRPGRLHDEKATAAGVLGALQELAGDSSPGDLVFVTYSGHGSQAGDPEGDEEEALDETLVLYDRQLLDDELWVAWSSFPAGSRIVLLVDSCHSGTVARLSTSLLGRRVAPGADHVPVDARSRRLPRTARDRDFELRAELYASVRKRLPPRADVAVSATIVLLTACQDDEDAYEVDGYGGLTKAFLDTWDGGSFRGGYFDLFQALAARVEDQSPNYLVLGREDRAFEAQQALA